MKEAVPRGNSPLRSSSSEPPALDLWGLLRRRLPLLLLVTAVCWVLAIVAYLVSPQRFESCSQLLVMRKDPRLTAQGISGVRESAAEVSDELLATQIEVLRSRRIVQQALEKGDLVQLPSLQRALPDQESSPVSYVINNLQVTQGGTGGSRGAHVLNLAFRHNSPEDCQRILTAVIDEYQAFLDERFHDVNGEAAEIISQAREELSSELEELRRAYQEYVENTPILWDGDKGTNPHRQRYDELQAELSRLAIEISESESRLRHVRNVLESHEDGEASDIERLAVIDGDSAVRLNIILSTDDSDLQASEPQRIQLARTEYQDLLDLTLKEQELLQSFGPRHPDVRRVQNQLSAAHRFLLEKEQAAGGGSRAASPVASADLTTAYVRLLSHDITALRHRKTELEAMAAAAEQAARQLMKHELAGESLRAEIDKQQALYDAAVDRLRQINLAKDYGGIINEVIGQAEVGKKVWPSLAVCLGLATVLGLFLGASGSVAAEVRDGCFREPAEISAAIGAPVLAHLSHNSPQQFERLSAAARQRGSTIDPSVCVSHAPRSRNSEAFRSLRNTLLVAHGPSERLQVIAVSSAISGEGKSTVAANLAVSLAAAGRRVLLVDCDLQQPAIHRLFGQQNEIGLSCIVQENDVEPWDAIQATEHDKLWTLPSGNNSGGPRDVVASAEFGNWLEAAREHYDHIVLDCPPVLASADACGASAAADTTAVVIRVEKQNRRRTIRAVEMLAEANANLLGVVVNDCDTDRHSVFATILNVTGRQHRYAVEGGMGQMDFSYMDNTVGSRGERG